MDLSKAQEEENEANEHDHGTVSPTVTLLVMVLILMTILFEKGKDAMIEAADRDTRPIIDSLFGEMTVLGFLSLFTFCLAQTGVFPQISVALFGKGEEGELLEIFEFVHYMLFFIMVFFVVCVLGLVFCAKHMEGYWRQLEIACRDDEYMEQAVSFSRSSGLLDEVCAGDKSLRSTTWLGFCQSRFFPSRKKTSQAKQFVKSLLLYSGIRREFILERSTEYPYNPKENRVDDDFNFGRYLGINNGRVLSEIVDVDITTWSFFGCIFMILYVFLRFVTNEVHHLAWLLTLSGWIHLIFRNIFEYHITTILNRMAVSPLCPKNAKYMRPFSQSESSFEEYTDTTISPTTSLTELNYASYESTEDSLRPAHSAQRKEFHQDELYWCGRKGPQTYLTLFQIQLVFTSTYVSLLCLAFLPFMFAETHWLETSFYIITSTIPVFFMMATLHRSVANVTIACCIGVHRHPQCVSQVIREEKTDRLIVAIVFMQKLHAAAMQGFPKCESIREGGDFLALHAAELELAVKTFEALDTDGSGSIDADEIESLLRALNILVSPGVLARIVTLLDTDNDDSVSKQEFVDFYKSHVLAHMMNEDVDLHEMAHDMFELFDVDHSHDISLGELKDIIDNFRVGFTVDEIGYLVNELDEDRSGTIGEEEFLDLLKKHSYLFQRQDLLPLP
jgi:Ca2+-binding EF-hand superfamily protein